MCSPDAGCYIFDLTHPQTPDQSRRSRPAAGWLSLLGIKKVTKESALLALRSAFLLPRFLGVNDDAAQDPRGAFGTEGGGLWIRPPGGRVLSRVTH